MKTKKRQSIEVFIALGSNLEPREKYLQRAVNLMSEHAGFEVVMVSASYETQPVGGPPDQEMYLNAVAKIRTTLDPESLLDALQAIERELGRKRDTFWGPRTIDLDILLYGREIISTDRLIVPHPLMHERKFVLEPLAQIAPDAVHPILQMTARTILESLGEEEP